MFHGCDFSDDSFFVVAVRFYHGMHTFAQLLLIPTVWVCSRQHSRSFVVKCYQNMQYSLPPALLIALTPASYPSPWLSSQFHVWNLFPTHVYTE